MEILKKILELHEANQMAAYGPAGKKKVDQMRVDAHNAAVKKVGREGRDPSLLKKAPTGFVYDKDGLLVAKTCEEKLAEGEKQLDSYETVLAILDGKVKSEGARPIEGKQHVQNDLLGEEGDYRLFYMTIYDATPEYTEIEAFVLFNKKTSKVSFYDNRTREIYIDNKYIGQTSNPEALDAVVGEYKLERGHAEPGACEAMYAALKEL